MAKAKKTAKSEAKKDTTETNPTVVTFLLDRSGSMESIRTDTIGAFNTYLGTLRCSTAEIAFSLIQFDTINLDKFHINAPIKQVPDLDMQSFVPRGGTPLIDAAYKTIKAVEKAVSERSDNPKVVICIQTDGQENSSVEFTWDQLQALIKEKSALGWQFNFMGASIDAYIQGARMGISVSNTVSYDSTNMANTMASFAATAMNTTGFASGALRSTAYAMGQKMASGDVFDPTLKNQPPKPVQNPAQKNQTTKPKPIVEDFTI